MKRVALFCAVAGCVLWADVASQPGLPEGRWAHPQEEPANAASTAVSGTDYMLQTPLLKARFSADSTRRRITAGEVLITTLPERISGRPVMAYEILRAPALSDLAGRSFFWRTRPRDEGRHRILFRAHHDTTATDSSTAPADTLALLVTVEARN